MKIALTYIYTDKPLTKIIAPLGLGYLMSYLEKYGNFTDIIVVKEPDVLLDYKPDLIGISTYTETFNKAHTIAKNLKEKLPNVPIILGGPHITNAPFSLSKYFDIGVIGEGEETFLNVVNTFLYSHYDFSNIKGIVYHTEKGLEITPNRKLIEDIDIIPLPKREPLKVFSPDIIQHIHTSRGCSFNCKFCVAPNKGKKIRYHSAERVIMELLEIKNKFPNTSLVFINDDLFTINLERLEKIIKLMKQENLEKYFSFSVQIRVDTFNQELALLLKKMNVKLINFGFESGSSRIVSYLKGRNVKVKDNIKAIQLCNEYGFMVGGYFLTGIPSETKEELNKTYWFIYKYRELMHQVAVTGISPFPNTHIWNDLVKNKKINPSKVNWDSFTFYFKPDVSIFVNEHYTLQYYKEAYNKFRLLEKFINDRFVPQGQQEWEQQQDYQTTVYKEIISLIPESVDKILEINDHRDELLFNLAKNNFEIITIKPNEELQNLKPKYFDLIIYEHTLEQLKTPKKHLFNIKKYIKPDGMLICIFYNIQYFSIFHSLLTSTPIHYLYGLNQTKNINFFSLKTLINLLNKGYKIKRIIPYQNTKLPILIQKELEIFHRYINNIVSTQLEPFSYIVISKLKHKY